LTLIRYRGVKIENFSTSWRNGLGFNALIHAHRPDLINYDALNPADHLGNLNNAFNVADDKLGIRRLLDAEGMITEFFVLIFGEKLDVYT
jgi:spectrin beta